MNNKSDLDTKSELPDITEDFKDNVKNWVNIDDNIREHRAIIKALIKEKKNFEKKILDYLQEIEVKSIDITGGHLRRNVSKTKEPIKKKLIENALYNLTKNKEKSITMTKYIMDSRPIKERINLKRTKNRGPKKKKN